MTHKDEMRTALDAARAIARKANAENREMNAAEIAEASRHLKDYEVSKDAYEKSAEAEKARQGEDLRRQLKSIGGGNSGTSSRPAAKAAGRSGKWARKALDAMETMGSRVGASDGAKALISGSISVPNILDNGEPVTIDAPKRTLLDLIGRGTPRGERLGNEFQYLRQTTRTNNAAAIADGRDKPVSEYGFGEVSDHYRTYVNKTEDLPYRYLADYETLVDVVKEQLAEDTLVAMEADVLSGTGPDATEGTDAFVGIFETPGVQAQPWATDLLTTLSNAKHKLIAQEQAFTGWVLNPADYQALEMLRENGATGPFLFGSREAIEAFLGAPVATSAGMPAGKALVGDFGQSELIPLDDDELVVDTGKRTQNNTFLLMYEGRYGFRVKKPRAFIEVQTTA